MAAHLAIEIFDHIQNENYKNQKITYYLKKIKIEESINHKEKSLTFIDLFSGAGIGIVLKKRV